MRTLGLFGLQYPQFLFAPICAVLAFARSIAAPGDRRRSELFGVVSLLSIPAPMLCQWVTIQLSKLLPYKLDLYIYHLDGLLGFQPSFEIGSLISHHLWAAVPLMVAYDGLPCAVVLMFGCYLWLSPWNEAVSLIRVFCLNLFLAVPIYAIVPVCGPLYAFPTFPHLPASFVSHPILLARPPNGVPSVHTSTALLILYFGWRWPIGRILAGIYLGFIILSTMGSGEHYFFDLLCAIPYVLIVLRVALRTSRSAERILTKIPLGGQCAVLARRNKD
jgi:hypothetical protein